ncbi:MAG: hypothetical protein R3E01_15355 [Pirellulaceae bacterium]|nr:hypothetical protein [Planctomycetales bacterium]
MMLQDRFGENVRVRNVRVSAKSLGQIGPIAVFTMLFPMLLTGCGFGPSRVSAPEWDPQVLTTKAFELYDKNSDGKLDKKELEASPGINNALGRIDDDRDGAVSQGELTKRFELYAELKQGLRGQSFRITLDGRPLSDANVRLVPEPFLEGLVDEASGVTLSDGVVTPQTDLDGEKFPAIRNGFYRVEVESPLIKTDRQKKSAAALGFEMSPVTERDVPAVYELRIKS